MDPATIMAALGVVSNLIGLAIASGDYEKARKLKEQAIAEYGDQFAPTLDKLTAQEVGKTETNQPEDPALRGQQVSVMRQLQDVYDKGGMTPGVEANLQLANQGVAQRADSDYRSLNNSLAQRGQQNNPALASALAAQAGQTTAGALATNRYQATADGSKNAMRALEMSGNLAGDVRGQDWQRASGIGGAQDAINRFNATQRTNTQTGNNQVALDQYGAEMELKNARNAARGSLANDYVQSGQRAQGAAAGVGDAMGDLGGYKPKKK